MTVGLMPLADSSWEQGKCSFKMLQYMACGVPAVVSPVGMNREVAQKGGALQANSELEWVDALRLLLADDGLRDQMGTDGRQTVEESYATRLIAASSAGFSSVTVKR